MGSNDACFASGAVVPEWLRVRTGRAWRKLTAFRVLAFGEPLFSVPAQSERPCRDSDALYAVLGAAPGTGSLAIIARKPLRVCDMDRQDEPR
jgi:hypothetical protein